MTFDSPVTRGYFDFITQQVGKPGKNATFTVSGNGRHVKSGAARRATASCRRRRSPTWRPPPPRAAAAPPQAGVRQGAAGLSYADARAMGITTRIGTYTTSVAGTANRLDNVGAGLLAC